MKRLWLLVALLWPLIAGAEPVILRPGAEGLDLSRYDVKNRGPRFIVSGGQLQLHTPKVQPDLMPRTLVKANFRYVGSSSLGVRLEDGTNQEYYCPGRLSSALGMTEWLTETSVCIGVYQGAEGRLAVVSAFPGTVVSLPEHGLKVPLGWSKISPAGASELVLRSPVGESFLCVVPTEPAVFLSATAATATGDGLKVYQDESSPWRVATWHTSERTFALVCPVQDFAVMLEMFREYVELLVAGGVGA